MRGVGIVHSIPETDMLKGRKAYCKRSRAEARMKRSGILAGHHNPFFNSRYCLLDSSCRTNSAVKFLGDNKAVSITNSWLSCGSFTKLGVDKDCVQPS